MDLGAGSARLTLGYRILLSQECRNDERVIAHELIHVAQFERYGGILNFLAAYLNACNRHGNCEAPMEREAAEFADSLFPK
jgi:hypothetical protein